MKKKSDHVSRETLKGLNQALVQSWEALPVRTWSLRLKGGVDHAIPIRNE